MCISYSKYIYIYILYKKSSSYGWRILSFNIKLNSMRDRSEKFRTNISFIQQSKSKSKKKKKKSYFLNPKVSSLIWDGFQQLNADSWLKRTNVNSLYGFKRALAHVMTKIIWEEMGTSILNNTENQGHHVRFLRISFRCMGLSVCVFVHNQGGLVLF